MQSCSLFVSRFRLPLLGSYVTSLKIVTPLSVAAQYMYEKRKSCYCRSAMFSSNNSESNDTTRSFAVYSLLLAAIILPAFGMVFYYRREQHKLLKKYEGENIYQTPSVDMKIGSLIQHNGRWFSLVMFPHMQRFEQIRHFTLKDDDILIVSFPKSGKIFTCYLIIKILLFTINKNCECIEYCYYINNI